MTSSASSPLVTAPTFEHHHSGLGLGTGTPRISWRYRSSATTAQGWQQTSYEVEVSRRGSDAKCFQVDSSDSLLVPWPDRALASRESATVRVRVRGKSADSAETDFGDWSEEAFVETSLLGPGDFSAKFITSPNNVLPPPDAPLRPLRFRKTFDLPPASKDRIANHSHVGRLYITALGVFNVFINGKSASTDCMAPGWTSYKHRLAYRTLDVTDLLLLGQKNTISAEVGEGWYAGRLGFGGGQRFRYGKELSLFAQLEVAGLSDDQASGLWTLVTDESWTTAPSAILTSEIYDGEVYDLREETPDWQCAHAAWAQETSEAKVNTDAPSLSILVAPDAPPVRVTEEVNCREVFRSKSGRVILDFGQNLVGKLSMRRDLRLANGQALRFTHAEVMEAGELGTRPLRIAKCMDTIIGSEDGVSLEGWTPRFTFHGFRYVQVDGWPNDDIHKEDIAALVLHTDMRRRGLFECSNPAVNQLHKNVVWSMRGNFLSVPTDCPQRDERLGWTGDLQAFCPTANFLYDTQSMLSNWLQDLSAEQLAPGNGSVVPLVVPEAMPSDWQRPANSQAIWGDVSVLAPNSLFQYSGDRDLLLRQYDSMKGWLDQGVQRAPDGLWQPDHFQLGDWLDPNAPPDDPSKATTDNVMVANAYLAYVTGVFASLCESLGKGDEAKAYRDSALKLKEQFQRRYITPDGNLVSLSQAGIAIAIVFGLYPDEPAVLERAADTLSALVRKSRFRISTGFAGTPVIAPALTKIGKPQLAYRMLLETQCPSWLYPIVSHDATTIWERWDSMLPDGSVNPGEMTSFNHYALGAIADWLHSSVGGISPLSPGWKVIRVRPVPGGNLTSAKTSFDGPCGLVQCEWTFDRDTKRFDMQLTVPPNCRAEVTLPCVLRLSYSDMEEEKSTSVGSGTHHFECDFDAGEWPRRLWDTRS